MSLGEWILLSVSVDAFLLLKQNRAIQVKTCLWKNWEKIEIILSILVRRQEDWLKDGAVRGR